MALFSIRLFNDQSILNKSITQVAPPSDKKQINNDFHLHNQAMPLNSNVHIFKIGYHTNLHIFWHNCTSWYSEFAHHSAICSALILLSMLCWTPIKHSLKAKLELTYLYDEYDIDGWFQSETALKYAKNSWNWFRYYEDASLEMWWPSFFGQPCTLQPMTWVYKVRRKTTELTKTNALCLATCE